MNDLSIKVMDVMGGYLRISRKVHEHGLVALVDMMPRLVQVRKGDIPSTGDSAVVQAARVSYGGGEKTPEEDEALIRYLMRNQHTTPFEMVEFKFHVSLPIFIARQWIRHRTASVNEVSARYTELPDNYYLPGEWRQQGKGNKQGGEEPMEYTPRTYDESCEPCVVEDLSIHEYHARLEAGMSRELARTCLPVSIYTQWYWKIDLHNLLRFLSLRADSHAQKEIRDYADAIIDIIEPLVPVTMKAWRDYVVNSVKLSALEVAALRAEIAELRGTPTIKGLSTSNQRENAEWEAKKKTLGLSPNT